MIQNTTHSPYSLLLLIILALPAIHLHATEGYRIDDILFSGNASFESDQLADQIVQQPNSFFRNIQFWLEPYRFQHNEFERDRVRLIRFYQTEGYLNVEISDSLFADDESESVVISYRIREGRPVLVDSIGTTGTELPPAPEEEPYLLLPGRRFRDDDLREDETTIRTWHLNHGYPLVSIRSELALDTLAMETGVIWDIQTGPECTFDSVHIEGNSLTPSSLIRRRLAFALNQTYNEELLRTSQRKIFDLGVFRFVTVRIDPENRVGSRLPVNVVVREIPTHDIKIGAGWGIEDRFRVFTDYRLFGLLGGGRTIRVYAKHSHLEPYHTWVALIEPALFGSETRLTVKPYIRENNERSYRLQTTGIDLTLQRSLTPWLVGYINYGMSRHHLLDTDLDLSEVEEQEQKSLYNAGLTTLTLVHDTAAPAIDPREGRYLSVSGTYSGLGFQTSYYYWKGILEGRFYMELARSFVLATRARAGLMRPVGSSKTTPIEDRFYAGGGHSLRGWWRNEVGPRDDDDTPMGGHSWFESAIELRYPIWEPLSGVVFLEAGNVWLDEFHIDLGDLRADSGAGLRYATPFGPIRVDIAVPVFEQSNELVFHISIGQAF